MFCCNLALWFSTTDQNGSGRDDGFVEGAGKVYLQAPNFAPVHWSALEQRRAFGFKDKSSQVTYHQ
jgi:hypothetical protein